jgi:FMN phosphatase YigB (HAD superfamily)
MLNWSHAARNRPWEKDPNRAMSSGIPIKDQPVELLRSDLEMIRVYEDLVDVLINKRIICLTDLPQPAQEKLLRRKHLRSLLASFSEMIPAEEDGIL